MKILTLNTGFVFIIIEWLGKQNLRENKQNFHTLKAIHTFDKDLIGSEFINLR